MAKLLKLLTIVIAAVVGLVALALLAVVMFFDPNDYKTEIAAAVEDATGRSLTLDGDLELQVFPRLRIALGRAALSNSPGFGDGSFASIESARLQLGLLPLILSQRLEIDEARLAGLTLNLARNAQGRGNWEDLGGNAPAPADVRAETPADAMAMSFEVQAIAIDDANVTWTDAVTGANWQLSDFNLDMEDFGPDTVFPMRMSFALTGTDLAIDLAAEMQATLGLADNDYLFEDLTVDIDGRGAAWPGGESALSVSFAALEADLDAETVELRGFALEFLDVNVNGTLSGRQLFSDLTLAGRVEIDAFDPQDLLEALGIELETADADVLRNASATAELAYGPNQMMLQNMTLQLDDSELVGALGMRGETLSFDLAIDAINVDRYLPPAEEAPADDEGSLDEVDLPLDALRSFNAAGNMRVGEFQFNGLSFADFVLQLAASDGRVRLTPSASLYGGSYAGTIGMDVQQNAATLTVRQQLELVDVTPLLRDLLDVEMFTGTLDLEMDVSASGANMGEVMRQLDGDVSFAMTDGAWEGVDMWHEMRRARALARQETAPARPAGEARTAFSRIAASGVIDDAVLTNNDFTAGFGFMTVAGAGTVELLNDVVDFDVTARFVDGELLQSDPLMADLAGDELPLRVTGSLAAPTVRPDFGALVRARAQEAVQERVEEEREQIQERVQDRLRGLFDR